jgi:hypothetical protein
MRNSSITPVLLGEPSREQVAAIMTRPLKPVLRRVIRFLLFAAVVTVLRYDGARGQQNTITGYNQVLGQWDASGETLTQNP